MGNKSILMSIQPRWVAEILNGKKTIEVRKKFPKDYVGWVYIYCTKGNGCLDYDIEWKTKKWFWWTEKDYKKVLPNVNKFFNGKVVAKFWCDKVETIRFGEYILNHNPISHYYFTASVNEDDFIKKCGMYNHEEYLDNYLGKKTDNGYAIHISKLEVFDKPKELKQKAPQSWCYIEVE